jgi:PAS domain S-box-containing protein
VRQVLDLQPSSVDFPVVAHRGFQVVVTDPDGLTIHVNTAFSLNTGYSLSEMQGRTPGAVLQRADADPDAVRQLRDARQSGEGCIGVEVVNYRKDGSAFNSLIDIEPVRDASGAIVQFVSVQTEVSELRRHQRELSDLRLRVKDVLALGSIGFWERDLATGSGLADDNALALLGLSGGGGTPSWDTLRAQVLPASRAAFERYFDDIHRGVEHGSVRFAVQVQPGGTRELQLSWTRRGRRLLETLVDVDGPSRP